MVEQQRQRIEQAMTKLVNEVDMEFLRQMQANMHRCAAKCCENRTASLESVQKCVENCGSSLQWSQNFVQGELEQLQSRLQRCVMDCNDDIRLQLGPKPTEAEITKFTALFENCATKCVDNQLQSIPQLSKRIKTQLSEKLST